MALSPIYLGVNIDHVATIRQARLTHYPDPVKAALDAEMAGADSITLHLREDRRHILDHDVERMVNMAQTKVNLEMAVTDEMVDIACRLQPADVCLVPEKREELTTEGGLDVAGQLDHIQVACDRLASAGVRVSLFIDADATQIVAAQQAGAPVIELHTGHYAEATTEAERQHHLSLLQQSAKQAQGLGLQVNAGHGLTYHNVQPVARIPQMVELNIGHAIVAQALFDGMAVAVQKMKGLMNQARQMG